MAADRKHLTKKTTDTEHDPLSGLLRSTGLWRASSIQQDFRQHCSSGYEELDHELPGSGWPAAGVTECLHANPGIGELRLLAPALARLSTEQQRWLLFVSPPYLPYAPALAQAGIDLSRVVVSQPGSHKDYLWVLEKSLASNCCSAVLAWPSRINAREIRRLQVASKEGNAWGILFRDERMSAQASPAELRIRLRPAPGYRDNSRVIVKILKRMGSWESEDIQVCLNDQLQQVTPDFSELTIRQPQHSDDQAPDPASVDRPADTPADPPVDSPTVPPNSSKHEYQ